MPKVLTAALIGAALITRKCFRRPNPPPAKKQERDFIFSSSILVTPDLRERVCLVLAVAHIILAASQFPPPGAGAHAPPSLLLSLLCPNPDRLDRNHFSSVLAARRLHGRSAAHPGHEPAGGGFHV
jgi:hypothetical protein